jgi:hypothetical protein
MAYQILKQNTIRLSSRESLLGLIIPGNLASGRAANKSIFQRKLPLAAKESQGQLHREICPFDKWWVTEREGFQDMS